LLLEGILFIQLRAQSDIVSLQLAARSYHFLTGELRQQLSIFLLVQLYSGRAQFIKQPPLFLKGLQVLQGELQTRQEGLLLTDTTVLLERNPLRQLWVTFFHAADVQNPGTLDFLQNCFF
jgi:hypothetical protein